MRRLVLAGLLALPSAASMAQTATPPQPPVSTAPAPTGQKAAAQQGGPANLCKELLAFMKAPPEPITPAAAPKPGASAHQASPTQQPPGQQPGSNKQGSSAMAGTTAAGEGASAKSNTGTSSSSQETTGQKGVATDAPEPGKDKAASGSVQNAPQKDARAAPTPPADVTSTPKESVLTMAAAEQLASANDIARCQTSAREMRVAGVAMPPPLIALAALDLRFQQKSGAAPPPSGTATPAPTGKGAPQSPPPQ